MNDQKYEFKLPLKIGRYLALLSEYCRKKEEKQLEKIIINSETRIAVGRSYDNWNGGIHGHALYFVLPQSVYLDILDEKDKFQHEIKEGINKICDIENEFIEDVFFEIATSENHDWHKNPDFLTINKKTFLDSTENRIWETGCFRVFLSHKAEVKKKTAALKDRLKIYGISCFVAHEDIDPTREWQNEIEIALHTMNSFVALLTEDFHDSAWTDQEVGFAFGRGIPILSVRLGKDPYGFIGKFQALTCTWNDAPLEIAKILIKNELMLDAYINAIRKSQTYDSSNVLFELLPSIEKLSETQVNNLIEAFEENSQVYDNFGFKGNRGLAYHLSRITGKEYCIDRRKKIKIM